MSSPARTGLFVATRNQAGRLSFECSFQARTDLLPVRPPLNCADAAGVAATRDRV
jgi:hypothetical protein